MKHFNITLTGTTPYMQHRMDDTKLEEWEKKRGAIIEREEVAHEDAVRAEYHCYRNSAGKCYMPADHIRMSLIAAGSYVKSKVGNARKNMSNIIAAMFRIDQDELLMPDYDAIDKPSAVNKNVKARIMVIRPKWSTGWKISFKLTVTNDSITKETIKDILEHAGMYVGIGSYRPANKGPFGQFEITKFEEIKL